MAGDVGQKLSKVLKKFWRTHFEWRMLEGKELRGEEARKKHKSPKIGQKTYINEHPPTLGASARQAVARYRTANHELSVVSGPWSVAVSAGQTSSARSAMSIAIKSR